MVFWKLVNSKAKSRKYSKFDSLPPPPPPPKKNLSYWIGEKMRILKIGMLGCENDLKKNLLTLKDLK